MALSRTSILFNSTSLSSGAMTATSASFTPPSNSLLVVFIKISNDGTAGTTAVSGGGLSWTKANSNPAIYQGGSPPDFYTRTDVWIAQVGTAAPMTITMTSTEAVASAAGVFKWQIVAYTGYDTVTPIGALANNIVVGDGALTINLGSAPSATSIVLAGRNREDNGTANATAQPGAGWTTVYDDGITIGGYDLETMEQSAGTTSTAVTWILTSVGIGLSTWHRDTLAVEIRAAGSSPVWGFETDSAQKMIFAQHRRGSGGSPR